MEGEQKKRGRKPGVTRPMVQKTMDIYKDQQEFLVKYSKEVEQPVNFLIRAAIDEMYGLPKKKS